MLTTNWMGRFCSVCPRYCPCCWARTKFEIIKDMQLASTYLFMETPLLGPNGGGHLPDLASPILHLFELARQVGKTGGLSLSRTRHSDKPGPPGVSTAHGPNLRNAK